MCDAEIFTFGGDEVQGSWFLREDRTHQPQEPEESDERFDHSRHGSGALKHAEGRDEAMEELARCTFLVTI